jgi:hypothetical protein
MYALEVRFASHAFEVECRAQLASSSVPLQVSADPIADSPATIAPIVMSFRILISSNRKWARAARLLTVTASRLPNGPIAL